MHILILGANGQVGAVLSRLAISRGHSVSGVTRSSTPDFLSGPGTQLIHGDAYDKNFLTSVSSGVDVVVNATRPSPGREAELVQGSINVAEVCHDLGVRLVVSGGAGSLPVSDDEGAPRTINTEFVQDAWRDIAVASTNQFDTLMESLPDSDWTYVAPPANLIDGPELGNYRLSFSSLVQNQDGVSELSWRDFADLLLNEIESPSGHRIVTGGY